MARFIVHEVEISRVGRGNHRLAEGHRLGDRSVRSPRCDAARRSSRTRQRTRRARSRRRIRRRTTTSARPCGGRTAAARGAAAFRSLTVDRSSVRASDPRPGESRLNASTTAVGFLLSPTHEIEERTRNMNPRWAVPAPPAKPLGGAGLSIGKGRHMDWARPSRGSTAARTSHWHPDSSRYRAAASRRRRR